MVGGRPGVLGLAGSAQLLSAHDSRGVSWAARFAGDWAGLGDEVSGCFVDGGRAEQQVRAVDRHARVIHSTGPRIGGGAGLAVRDSGRGVHRLIRVSVMSCGSVPGWRPGLWFGR